MHETSKSVHQFSEISFFLHALLQRSRISNVPYISELTQGTNKSLVSFTSLVISSDNVNRGLVLFLLLCLIYRGGCARGGGGGGGGGEHFGLKFAREMSVVCGGMQLKVSMVET